MVVARQMRSKRLMINADTQYTDSAENVQGFLMDSGCLDFIGNSGEIGHGNKPSPS